MFHVYEEEYPAGKHQRDNQEARLHVIWVRIGAIKVVSDPSVRQSAVAFTKDLRGVSIINNRDVTPSTFFVIDKGKM